MPDLPSVKPIDIHLHPFTAEAIDAYGPPFQEAARKHAQHRPHAPQHAWVETGRATTIEDTRAMLAAAGVEKACMLNMVAGHQWAAALANDVIARYCRTYPEWFIGFAGIDPHMDSAAAVRELLRARQELGLVGVKFHPAYQACYPHDRRRMYPLYEQAQALGMPVVIHTGTTTLTRTGIAFCRPIYLDQVAVDFPDLRLVLSHFGWPWVDEAIAVAWRHEHVYLDLSGWLPRYIYGVAPTLIHFMNTVLQDKVCFGSDYPVLHPSQWLSDFQALFLSGYEWGGRRHEFHVEVYSKVLRTNALRILGLLASD